MAKHIEYFFVGQDVQIQIDHTNPEWYDKYGKLLIEDVDQFLQDNDFVDEYIGGFSLWRYTEDDTMYEFTKDDIDHLKRNGWTRMYRI